MTVIWCMVPKIWSATDRIVCHFGSFFLPFYPPNNPKNQIFDRMKKMDGDIMILLKFTINDNHMMYGSWNTKCDSQNFLLFWTVFCPTTPLTPQNIKILKSLKIHQETLLPYISVPKIMIIYTAPEIWCARCNYFSFWAIFYPFTPLTSQKIKILK